MIEPLRSRTLGNEKPPFEPSGRRLRVSVYCPSVADLSDDDRFRLNVIRELQSLDCLRIAGTDASWRWRLEVDTTLNQYDCGQVVFIGRRPFLASVLLLAFNAYGQVPVSVPKAGTLEVASVKESQEDRGGSLSIQPGGRFVATNIRVRDMVNMAFRTNPGLLSQQIIGLPPWTITTRYNVEARFSGDETTRTIDRSSSGDIVGAYVRALLDSRFAFRAHLEKREMPVYVVTVAQSGFKPPASPLDCSNPNNFSQCATTFASGRVASHHLDFAVLLNQLSSVTGRPLIDQSGLKGQFDIDLQWNPEQLTDATDARPSIFGAVQELGLKLESGKALVDALVIDQVERPMPD